MNQLSKSMSAAKSITAFMRYLLAKKRYNSAQARKKNSETNRPEDQSSNYSEEGTGVDLKDIMNFE